MILNVGSYMTANVVMYTTTNVGIHMTTNVAVMTTKVAVIWPRMSQLYDHECRSWLRMSGFSWLRMSQETTNVRPTFSNVPFFSDNMEIPNVRECPDTPAFSDVHFFEHHVFPGLPRYPRNLRMYKFSWFTVGFHVILISFHMILFGLCSFGEFFRIS